MATIPNMCIAPPQGGIAGGIGIKVGNMVSACCECNPGGSIADLSYPEKRLSLLNMRPKYGPSATVRNHARQREENE